MSLLLILKIYLFLAGVLFLIHWPMSKGNAWWARVIISLWLSFWPPAMISAVWMIISGRQF